MASFNVIKVNGIEIAGREKEDKFPLFYFSSAEAVGGRGSPGRRSRRRRRRRRLSNGL